jgi:hypothetical protein
MAKTELAISIRDIPSTVIARKLFGPLTPTTHERVRRWMSGYTAITVDVFWEICQAFPHVDPLRSMQDLYDVRLLALAKRRARKKANYDDLT